MKYNIAPLIRARQLKRWSATELAAKIGRSENMVRKIESGTRTSEKTIFKMSEVLEVPMEEILIEPAVPRKRKR
jgi:ribosome-binding protein aMBF1 (putative translation factor)